MNVTWDGLPLLFPDVADPERWLPLLQRHAELVEGAADRVRVSSVSAEDAVGRQYAESLELLRVVRMSEPVFRTLVDVGSGGGFPGMVIAIASPEVEVHLVEPLRKRAGLLQRMATELQLENVTVHAARAEDAGRGSLRDRADVVTARAVAELRELLEYTAPFAQPGGLIALPKGSGFSDELLAAENALAVLGCEFLEFVPMRSELSATPGAALVRKLTATPDRYPRRAGVPGKRPL